MIELLTKELPDGVNAVNTFWNTPMNDPYLITWLRYSTSLHLQLNQDNFLPYVMEHGGVKHFCTTQVEPVKKEADQVQCIALSQFFKIPIRIYYLDQSSGGINCHDFPHGSEPTVHLLYRPGHYDIIYKSES